MTGTGDAVVREYIWMCGQRMGANQTANPVGLCLLLNLGAMHYQVVLVLWRFLYSILWIPVLLGYVLVLIRTILFESLNSTPWTVYMKGFYLYPS
jgi:hypothetical protein